MDTGEGLPEALREDTDATLAETVALGEGFHQADGRLRYVLNPRFILSCSDALWQGIQETSASRGWPIHTHALEQQEESAAVRALKGGRDEIAYFEDSGILAAGLRIAHGVWLDQGHLSRVQGYDFSVVHCPSANLKLGSGIADVVGIRRAGIPVGIGADGAPCNNDLDLLEELRLAALLQQGRHGPESFSGLDALRLATSEGARAIGLDAEIGSIEEGKSADLLVLSLDRPELFASPRVDPHDVVAFGASRASVRHVIVEGDLLVEEGRLARLDLAEIRRQAEISLENLLQRSGLES
jgi:5-methylthioadenosine/S-adenosylhomocysteine deaminase